MMAPIAKVGRFWWDFVVGDDWVSAACIGVGLAVTAALAAIAIPAWWVMPATVAGTLYLTLQRAHRSSA